MCGGDAEPFARAEKVIASYARACNLMGSPGSGQLAKMVNQICIAGLVQGLSEGIHFAKKAGLDNAPRVLAEVRLQAAQTLKVGDVVNATSFTEGQLVDVIGVTKGKGFQGVMKRFRVAGGPASHGSMFHRRIGSVGMRQTPGRVWKNQAMPGHMGGEKRTVQNLRIAR